MGRGEGIQRQPFPLWRGVSGGVAREGLWRGEPQPASMKISICLYSGGRLVCQT